jgi:hypothetical protein
MVVNWVAYQEYATPGLHLTQLTIDLGTQNPGYATKWPNTASMCKLLGIESRKLGKTGCVKPVLLQSWCDFCSFSRLLVVLGQFLLFPGCTEPEFLMTVGTQPGCALSCSAASWQTVESSTKQYLWSKILWKDARCLVSTSSQIRCLGEQP